MKGDGQTASDSPKGLSSRLTRAWSWETTSAAITIGPTVRCGVAHFEARRVELCETCLGRMEHNPLRILDCKNPSCGVAAEQNTASRGFKAQMKSADASHAAWTCIIGPEEMEKGLVTVRNMADGSQTSLAPEFVAKDGE